MKIQPKQAAHFISSELISVSAILIYGPNEGLIREYSKNARKTINDDFNDPFASSNISGEQLKEYPGLLFDEVRSIGLSQSRKLIRVFDISDNVIQAFDYLLEDHHNLKDALVVCEASDLGPRSKLRKLFEQIQTVAAIPCYDDSHQEIRVYANRIFKEHSIELDKDSMTWLLECLGTDRAQIYSEINKIIAFMGNDKNIPIQDIRLLIGDSAEIGLDEVCYAIGDGNLKRLDRALYKLFSDGVSPIQILRAVSRHFLRLQSVIAHNKNKGGISAAVNTLRPPVFFKDKKSFLSQANTWTPNKIEDVIFLLAEAEKGCKSGIVPAKPLCSRALLNAASTGQRLQKV